MSKIFKGGELMLFNRVGNDVSTFAFATSHTLNITGNYSEIATKDHGRYPDQQLDTVDWEITTDNLFSSKSYNWLYNKLITGEKVIVGMAAATDWDITNTGTIGSADSVDVNWESTNMNTADTDHDSSLLGGSAVVTSLNMNANNGENATYSATFKGCGPIAYI